MNACRPIPRTIDIQTIVSLRPHLVAVRYRNQLYRYVECGWCSKMFWKSTTDKKNSYVERVPYTGRVRAYCCTAHRLKNWKVLNAARQKRWQQKQKRRR